MLVLCYAIFEHYDETSQVGDFQVILVAVSIVKPRPLIDRSIIVHVCARAATIF